MKHLLFFENYCVDHCRPLQERMFEYVTQEIINLKRYLKMDEEEKILTLPHQYPYFFDRFLKKYKNTNKENLELPSDYSPDDIPDEWLMDWLMKNNPDMFKGYGKYLYDLINDHNLPVPEEEYPTWVYLDRASIIKNQWLVHFCDDPYDIATEGFTKGVFDFTKLGLTTHIRIEDKEEGGYNFAYTIHDCAKYADMSGNNYGKHAVMFRASGVRVWHHGDTEYQVIFYGRSAKDIVPIYNIDGEWTIMDKKTDRVLKASGDFDNLIKWTMQNYNQYKMRIATK